MSESPNALPQWVMVDVADIEASPLNPRKHFDAAELQRLADDIARNGMHHPITLREHPFDPFGKYHVVMGERRFRAAKLAGLKEIPAFIRQDIDDTRHLLMAYNENENRENLSPVELGYVYANYQQMHPDATQAEIAEVFNTSQPVVSRRLKFRNFPVDAKRYLMKGLIPEAVAAELLRLLPWPQVLEGAAFNAMQEKWSQKQAEAEAKKSAESMQRTNPKDDGQLAIEAPEPETEPEQTTEPPSIHGEENADDAPNNPESEQVAEPEPAPVTEEPKAEALPEQVIAIRPEFLEDAIKRTSAQTIAEKKTPTVPLFLHGGQYYLISGSTSNEAWAYHVIIRADYDGPIRTYQECIDRLGHDRSTAFTGLVVKFSKREWVTTGQRVRFVPIAAPAEPVGASDSPALGVPHPTTEATTDPADAAEALEAEPLPEQFDSGATLLESPEPPPILAKLEAMRQAGEFEPSDPDAVMTIPAPKSLDAPEGYVTHTISKELDEWLWENGLTLEKALEQFRKQKPYACSPYSRRLVDKAMKLLPDDGPCQTPAAFIDGAIAIRAAQVGVEEEI